MTRALRTNRQQTGDPQTDQIWERISDLNDAVRALQLFAPGVEHIAAIAKREDQNFASATAKDVTDLAFRVSAGHLYRFEFLAVVQSDTSTVGVASSVTYPPAERFAATSRTMFASDGSGGEWQGAISTSDDPVVPTAVPASGTDYLLEVRGVILPSATGVLQLRARTETGTTVVKVRRGSMGFLWDLGAT